MIQVVLNAFEMFSAASVGVKRQIEALARNLPDRHGYSGSGWGIHIEGACGEMAVAKALGMYWGGSVNTFKASGDVGKLEVRTRSSDDYELLVRKDDADDATYILVTGTAPRYTVHGWLRGRDAKRSEWLNTHGGREAAYFVPQQALRNMDELVR